MDKIGHNKTYAVMSLHDILLAVPQSEIVNLDMASAAMPTVETGDGAVGELDYQGQSLPLFSLSDDLQLVNARPQDQNICVAIAVDGIPQFSLTCLAVKPMQLDMAKVFPIPDPMSDEAGPLRGIVVSENSVLFTSSAQALQSHIAHIGEQP